VDRPTDPTRARGAGPEDGGFTLVEVTVSLVLLAVVLAAALSLFVRAMANTDLQAQRGQAITLATDQLEQVRGIPVADLVTGRTAASVDSIWAWDTGLNGHKTYSVKTPDTTATSSSTPVVPTLRKQTIDNVDYIVRTYIDVCNLPTTGSTTCGAASSSSTKPMYRITVSVSWPSPKKAIKCDAANVTKTSSGCQEYLVTTLRDGSSEATFNTN
jgi:prepilin-type N-terminal cleavage/methylation domain-containing protein